MTKRIYEEELAQAFDGDPWHGGTTWPLLEELSAEEAGGHPLRETHSVWEIVLHMTAWIREVTRRLDGGEPALPEEGDWPSVGTVSEQRWREARGRLLRAHDGLLKQLRTMEANQLDAPVGQSRQPELGTGFTHAGMLGGLIQHNAYHSGQIALLRKQLMRRRGDDVSSSDPGRPDG
jgi:uncharacterized damage-inducible protein DinB